MYEILLIVYLLVAMFLIFMILIQQGKGADMGASFGAGSSNTLFGASGSGSFLTKLTTALATLFFVISITLGNLTANQVKKTDEYNDISAPTEQAAQGDAVKASTEKAQEDAPVSDIPADTDAAAKQTAPADAAKDQPKDAGTEGDKK